MALPFDPDRLAQRRPPGSLGQPLHALPETDSTNRVAWELAQGGAPTGTTVIAAQQSAGRGQWGRTWQSPAGGVYLSVLVRPADLRAEAAAQLTLASVWGIAQALRQRGVPVQIKWPNDLLLAGRKLGGILTETRLRGDRITEAVIGVGVNWRNPGPETGANLEAFADLDWVATAEAVLAGLDAGYRALEAGQVEAILPQYLELLSSLGARVRVQGRVGTVRGVTVQGDLRLGWESRPDSELAPEPAPEIALPPGTVRLGYPGSGVHPDEDELPPA